MIFVFAANRISRKLLTNCQFNILGGALLQIQADHVRPWNHDIPHFFIRKIEHVVNEVKLCFVDIAFFSAFLHQKADFRLGMSVTFTVCNVDAHKTMNAKGGMTVTHVNEIVQEVFEVTGFAEILTIE